MNPFVAWLSGTRFGGLKTKNTGRKDQSEAPGFWAMLRCALAGLSV